MRALRAWVLLTALSAACSARAAEDAGSQSIFAYGAGARALGMGGAACATEEGATLLFWNPGALGRLQRRELSLGHTSLYGLGFNEEFAAVAWPDYRWGVVAVGLRHYGVGGIEGRDDRNLLLDEDLTDLEQQLSLAYSRAFGDAWSLGANLKLRRQSLAGYSGGALGLDLGALVAPAAALGWQRAERLRLGLALRNAIQPTLRLDSESVRDPGVLRLGLAYGRPLAGLDLDGALDLEVAGQRSAQLHAGLELRYGVLALRGGYGYGRLHAGAELRWRDLGVDYVFEDNALEAVHRVGVSFRFGADVNEHRQAAAQARDDALQAQLDSAFAERQRAQVEDLLAAATAAREEGRADDALSSLATLLALAPGEARATALAARVHCDLAEAQEADGDFTAAGLSYRRALVFMPDHPLMLEGLARCQAESDRRAKRSAALRERFDRGLDAFGADRLLEARGEFRAILAQQPDDAEARAMLERTDVAIAHSVDATLEQAGRLLDRGLLDECDAALDEAAGLAADDPRIGALRGRALTQRRGLAQRKAESERVAAARASAKAAPAAPTHPALSAREKAELGDLYQHGMAAAQAGRGDEALRYWELIWSKDPDYQQVAEHLKREYLVRGMETFAAGRLEEAAALWEKALAVDPTDERAQGYLARAREQLARTQEIFKR